VNVQATRPRPSGRAELREVPLPASHSRLWLVALAAVLAVGALYHWLQSRGHVTPAVFTDELLFSELARSFAAGEGFVVRDQPLFFPAFVPALLQAPAWLAGSTPLAYALAKGLNTMLMCSAALPAYWLGRELVRPAYALIVAGATVAGGGMLYHGYLTSEAAAYPVFLLAIAVCVRALAAPSRSRDLIALAVLGLAVVTRAQFLVLPLVFALSIVLVGRPVRRHSAALAGLGGAAVIALVAGASSLGFYEGARTLDYPLGETLRWSVWTAALLPFAAGMLVAPGALLGLASAVFRPRTAAERAFGAITGLLLSLMPLQAGLIAAGEAHKPFERYVFYLLPLIFLAFFAFAERRVIGRRIYAGVAIAFGGVALIVPFSSLALNPFSFDSPTLSAVETLGRWTSQGDAAALVAAGGVLAALVAAALQRRPALLAVLSVALAFLIGVAAYAGDRRMTRRTLDSLAPAQPDWLERTGIPRADVLVLPGGSLHAGWVLESWNRNVGRTFHLGDLPVDPLPFAPVGFDFTMDGSVAHVHGKPLAARYLVINDYGARADLVGTKLKSLPEGLSLYRVDGHVRFRSLADGVYRDRWARSIVTYTAFPGQVSGRYRVTLSLPTGRDPRRVDVESGPVRRFATLRPGRRLTVEIPVSVKPVPPLAIRIERADFIDADKPRPRLVGARVEELEFVPAKGSRN
jgi:hypothetical protein